APVRIDVEHATAAVSVAEIEGLFARRSTSRARGLTLGLSLARSVVELHGGTVDIRAATDGCPVVTITLCLVRPRLPQRTSTKTRGSPALGVYGLAARRCGAAIGRVKKKRLPTPSSLSTQTPPPWASTMPFAMNSPRPVPSRESGRPFQ